MATLEVRKYASAMQPLLEEYVLVNADLERAAGEGSQKHFSTAEKQLADCVRRLSGLDARLQVVEPPGPFQIVHTDLVSALNTYRAGVTGVYTAAQSRNAEAMDRAVEICQQALMQFHGVMPRLQHVVREQA